MTGTKGMNSSMSKMSPRCVQMHRKSGEMTGQLFPPYQLLNQSGGRLRFESYLSLSMLMRVGTAWLLLLPVPSCPYEFAPQE